MNAIYKPIYPNRKLHLRGYTHEISYQTNKGMRERFNCSLVLFHSFYLLLSHPPPLSLSSFPCRTLRALLTHFKVVQNFPLMASFLIKIIAFALLLLWCNFRFGSKATKVNLLQEWPKKSFLFDSCLLSFPPI